jgi:hypothetical protein
VCINRLVRGMYTFNKEFLAQHQAHEGDDDKTCAFCKKPGAAHACTCALKLRYCSKECQQSHFIVHKKVCSLSSATKKRIPKLVEVLGHTRGIPVGED